MRYAVAVASIRKALASDAAAIAHVQVATWRTAYAGIVPAAFLDSLNETQRAAEWAKLLVCDVEFLVAELCGRVVGFICGGPVREPVEGCDAEIYAVYLLNSAQRSGIGTGLLEALAAALAGRGFAGMSVWVLDQNPCKQFYTARGAHCVRSKEIEIGGAQLVEEAYAWFDLKTLIGK